MAGRVARVSPRRINPRHVTHHVHVATATYTHDGITTITGEPARVRCQVEHTVKLVATDDGPLIAAVLTLRIPPMTDFDPVAVFTPDSPVTFRDATSWVLSTKPVYRAGVHAYTQVITGEMAERFGGGWPVTITIHHTPGRDARGTPRPAVDVPDVPAVLVPSTTNDPTDWSEDPEARADLFLPGDTTLASTDRITIQDPGILPARWQIDGIPSLVGPRVKATISRLT